MSELPHTDAPWVRRGNLIHGLDGGGFDIGPLIAECDDEDDAAYIVALVNEKWRLERGTEVES